MLRVIARGPALLATALVLAVATPAISHAEDVAPGTSALGIDYPSIAENDAALAARCGDSGFFLRGDVADVGVYFQNGVSVVESGALLSIASDNGATTASVNGAVGYAFNQNCLPNPPGAGAYVSGYVIAPWLLASGNFYDSEVDDNDTKIQAGLTGQVEIAEAIFDVQYLTVSPYYQTDFDFEAEVYGGQLSWRPIMTEIHLGGTTTLPEPCSTGTGASRRSPTTSTLPMPARPTSTQTAIMPGSAEASASTAGSCLMRSTSVLRSRPAMTSSGTPTRADRSTTSRPTCPMP